MLAGMGKLVGSQAAINRQNRYNSPVEQIRRLRQAGLPFAAFQAGQAGNQAQLPDLSGYDMMGSAIGTGISQANQATIFKELLSKAQSDAGIASNLFGISEEEFKAGMGHFSKGPMGNDINMFQYSKLLDIQAKEYSVWISKHREKIEKIDKLIKEARFEDGTLMDEAIARMNSVMLSNDLAKQAWNTNDSRNRAAQRIVDTMSKGGLSFLEALFLQIIGSLGGGVNMGGMNLGF